MARAALGWSTRKLAELADVALNTVNRFEGGMNSRENNIGKIRVALEKAGIEFDTDGQGVQTQAAKAERQAEMTPAQCRAARGLLDWTAGVEFLDGEEPGVQLRKGGPRGDPAAAIPCRNEGRISAIHPLQTFELSRYPGNGPRTGATA